MFANMPEDLRLKYVSAQQAISLANRLEREGKIEESAAFIEEAAVILAEVRTEQANIRHMSVH